MSVIGSIAEHDLAFLRKLQRLLDEGEFVATYKFALLQALADLAVERAPSNDGSLIVTLEQIAAKFIEYYWRQAMPYGQGVLRHSTSGQAAIVTRVIEARRAYDGDLLRLQREAKAWRRIVRNVARVVERMPLWKLQTVGGESDEFLYRQADFRDSSIRLLPGVPRALRAFHPLITQVVRGGWVDQVRHIGHNQRLLGSVADLHEFLFGSDRHGLVGYRTIVRDFQKARCFYCDRETRRGEADHFIPWSRYSVDLGHNFVYACAPCNHAKRDYLAGLDHLNRWHETNVLHGGQLADAFRALGLAHDLARSEFVASWAYEQGEMAGAHCWVAKDSVVRIDARWRDALMPLSAVAEPRPGHRLDR